MKTLKKYSKYYYHRLQEISEEELQNTPEFYDFLMKYHSDLITRMRDIYEGIEKPLNSYAITGKIGDAIAKHAKCACQYHVPMDYALDNIRITWYAKIREVSEFDAPELAQAYKNPAVCTIKFPVLSNTGDSSEWGTVDIFFDKADINEKAILTPKVRLHYANRVLRIYAISRFIVD